MSVDVMATRDSSQQNCGHGTAATVESSCYWHLSDPCAVLGLRYKDRSDATKIRTASRALLRALHPDRAVATTTSTIIGTVSVEADTHSDGQSGSNVGVAAAVRTFTTAETAMVAVGAVVGGLFWVTPGTCEICDGPRFTDVVKATATLLASCDSAAEAQTADASSDARTTVCGHCNTTDDGAAATNVGRIDDGVCTTCCADSYGVIVRCAEVELDEAADPTVRVGRWLLTIDCNEQLFLYSFYLL